MVEIDVRPLAVDIERALVERAVIESAAELGLLISSDGSLRKHPGSRHWHMKKAGRSGTLEVTFWPAKQRLWIGWHANRSGDGWVESTAHEIACLLRSK